LKAFAGAVSWNVSVTFTGPSPELTAALNSFTAVGAVAPAGNVIGYVSEFVGVLQFPEPAAPDPAVATVAVVGRVLAPAFVKVVDVPVMFQPAPLAVSSSGVSTGLVETVWFVPLSVTEGKLTPGAPIVLLPPPHIVKKSITPAAATAHPVLELANDVAANPCAVPDVCAVQFVPPLEVVRIVPEAPTAQHVVVLTQLMPVSAFVVPDVCAAHDVPPFAVFTMVPDAPTAQQLLVPEQLTAFRLFVVPDV